LCNELNCVYVIFSEVVYNITVIYMPGICSHRFVTGYWHCIASEQEPYTLPHKTVSGWKRNDPM